MRILHALRSRSIKPLHACILVCVVVAALVLGIARLFRGDAVPTADVPAVTWEEETTTNDESQTANDVTDAEPVSIADEQPQLPTTPTPTQAPHIKNLALPFTPQAPTGNWDVVHEDTCEEASVYMVAQYFDGVAEGVMNSTTSDNAMLALVTYEDAHEYGYSVSAAELKAIIEDYYSGKYEVNIYDNPTADDIKTFINDGYPVIVPAAGQQLGNPFFTGEGPLYHMLVVRGYEDGRFIANDPGTRHGENYTYAEDVLMSAIHDWNNGDPVNGTPRVLVMTPESSE